MFAQTPNPPYYAVIFTSILNTVDPDYIKTNNFLIKEAEKLKGYLGQESARNDLGVSVSYWSSLKDIQAWRQNTHHQLAINRGKQHFYKKYKVRIALVERDYLFVNA